MSFTTARDCSHKSTAQLHNLLLSSVGRGVCHGVTRRDTTRLHRDVRVRATTAISVPGGSSIREYQGASGIKIGDGGVPGPSEKKNTWLENDGRAERPGLKGLAVFGSHLHLSTSHQVAVAHWRF